MSPPLSQQWLPELDSTKEDFILPESSIPKHMPDFRDWLHGALIVPGLILLVYLSLVGGLLNVPGQVTHGNSRFSFVVRPGILRALLGSLFLMFRTALWFNYHSLPKAGPEHAPSLRVIIPAYNEGAMVEKAIYSVQAVFYPLSKLETIAMDNGSKDDTWTYIKRAANKNPRQGKGIRFPFNQGKREALAEGFRRAQGERVLAIDSDSVMSNYFVARGSLKKNDLPHFVKPCLQ